MLIRQPKSYLGIRIFATGALLDLIRFSVDRWQYHEVSTTSGPWIGVLFVMVIYSKIIQFSRSVQIDALGQSILETRKNWLFLSRYRTYALSQFKYVVSYIQPGRIPVNRVELVTKAGGESLLVATFDPSNRSPNSFWSVPVEEESEQAMDLRANLAQRFGFVDQGFVGRRWEGARVRCDSKK